MLPRFTVWFGLSVTAFAGFYALLLNRTPDVVASAPAAQQVAEPGVAAPAVTPAAEAPPAGPSPTLLADVAAYVAGRAAALPAIEGQATLTTLAADGARLLFEYRIAVVAAEFDQPDDSDPVAFSAIEAYACDDGVCFQFVDDFVARPCGDAALRPLIDAGAIAVYTYRDNAGVELGTRPIGAAECRA